jgi:hypothetical protein
LPSSNVLLGAVVLPVAFPALAKSAPLAAFRLGSPCGTAKHGHGSTGSSDNSS